MTTDRTPSSPAAVPDVTALAQVGATLRHRTRWEDVPGRPGIRQSVHAVEECEFCALLALVEQTRQACNICEEPWPHHAEACSYPANVRRMQKAERERDEAQAREREMREAGTKLASAAERLEANPLANCLPRFRLPVLDAIDAWRELAAEKP